MNLYFHELTEIDANPSRNLWKTYHGSKLTNRLVRKVKSGYFLFRNNSTASNHGINIWMGAF